MPSTDITQTTKSDMDSRVSDFSVSPQTSDGATQYGENVYDSPNFSTYYGYYKTIPQCKKAIDAFATWVLGKGFTTDNRTQVILDNITGRGDEDFLAVLWNMKVIAKVNGDSFSEIMRNDKGTLINLKPLSPENIRVVFSKKGIITRYEDKRTNEIIPKNKMLHFSNDRTADEMGGTSVIPAVKWCFDARQEAMEGYRRILHRSTIRVLYVDEDNTTRLANLKRDYAEAMDKGELLIIPVAKKDGEFQDLTTPPVQSFLEWIRYLENFGYIAVGIPKVIMGSVDSIPESGGKISYLTYEQIYQWDTRQMESDLWNQLAFKIKFIPPASIAEGVADEKSNAQTGFQPNDTTAGVGK